MLLPFANDAFDARIRRFDTARTRRIVCALALLGAALVFLIGHQMHFAHPTAASLQSGWWRWTDQGRYYRSARAWAHLDLRPSEHWYLPGYPLMGALFYWLMPAEPFMLPNLICMVLTGALTIWLAEALAGDRPFGWAYGVFAFVVSSVLSHMGLKAWIEPWTSTPLAPLVLGTLLAALRFAAAPRAGRAFLCGLLCGGIVMVRPTEAMAAGPPAALFCLWTLLRAPLATRARIAIGAAGVIGAVLPLAAVGVTHLAIYGFAQGEYLAESLGTGFELRLLPLRWVILAIAPEPLHEDGPGLALLFPWVLPGFAGMIAALLTDRGRRAAHMLIATAVALHWVFYLCYRDLHPEGLWRFGNYHYFKWTEPVLGLYAVLLLAMLVTRRQRWGAVAGCAVMLLAACWRAELVPLPSAQQDARVDGSERILVPSGLTGVGEAVAAATLSGGDDDIYFSPHRLSVGPRVYGYNETVKAYPLPGGMVVTTLRPVQPGPVRIDIAGPVRLDPSARPMLASQRIVFALPCMTLRRRAACRPPRLDPAPGLPLGADVSPGGAGDRYFTSGWFARGPGEQCTLGATAELRFAPDHAGPLLLTLSGTGFPAAAAAAAAPTRVALSSGSDRLADWSVPAGQPATLTARIPDPGGPFRDLRLHVVNPRKLKDFGDPTGNQALGICVRHLRLTDAG